ncbi:MAG: Lrp/AsnC ligand binding domain-containing protein [Burkholderiaceae bacterium]
MPIKSKPVGTDRIDWKILRALQNNGRMSIVDLAEQVGLSKTPCAERVRKLEANGLITGYQALVDPRAAGQAHIAMVQVVMARTTADSLDQFNKAVRKIKQVQCCFMIAGDFDYLLKIRTRDIDDYRRLMTDVIAHLPGVQQTHTYVVMESVKDTGELLLDGPSAGGIA